MSDRGGPLTRARNAKQQKRRVQSRWERVVFASPTSSPEEIVLPTLTNPPSAVEVVGALQPTPTIATGYAVYPFVGLIEPGHRWAPSPTEVADVLELPLAALEAGRGRRRLLRRGVPFRTDTFVVDRAPDESGAVGSDLVWGATARILSDLLVRLA